MSDTSSALVSSGSACDRQSGAACRHPSRRACDPGLHLVARRRGTMATWGRIAVVVAPVPDSAGCLATRARFAADHSPRPDARDDPCTAGGIGSLGRVLEPPIRTSSHRPRPACKDGPASGLDGWRRPSTARCFSSRDRANSTRSTVPGFFGVLESMPGAPGACPTRASAFVHQRSATLAGNAPVEGAWSGANH